MDVLITLKLHEVKLMYKRLKAVGAVLADVDYFFSSAEIDEALEFLDEAVEEME